MTARRITAAILIAIGLTAGAGIAASAAGTATTASAPATWYHQ